MHEINVLPIELFWLLIHFFINANSTITSNSVTTANNIIRTNSYYNKELLQ
jgi:hypothetical protein